MRVRGKDQRRIKWKIKGLMKGRRRKEEMRKDN